MSKVETAALEYKVLVLGNTEVGKSSLIKRYTTGKFPRGMLATVGVDFRSKEIQVEGVPVLLKVWDTAGQERFFTFTKQFFRGAEGVILMYDITSQSTFSDIDRWLRTIRDAGLGDESLMIIGNKYDLAEDERDVDTFIGQELADCNSCKFFETSAKTGHNVEEAFYEVARGILYKKGVYLPGRLPSLGPMMFAQSDRSNSSASNMHQKSIILGSTAEQPTSKKKCCVSSS